MYKWVPANLISALGIILGWPSNNPSRGSRILLVASCYGDRSAGQTKPHGLHADFIFFVCCAAECHIKHLMTGPEGNSEFFFPRISMFPETKSRETSRFEGNKIHCSPRDQ